MREKEYSEWISKQGFDLLRHANCCKIAFNGGWESRQTKVDELQKRVDAVKQLIEEYRDPPTEDKTFQHALSIVADELEQALKGGEG